MRGASNATRTSDNFSRPAGARDQVQDGDILISRESKSPDTYTVRQLPGNAQLTMASRDEAERLGRAFAPEHRVNLWYTDGHPWELLLAARREARR